MKADNHMSALDWIQLSQIVRTMQATDPHEAVPKLIKWLHDGVLHARCASMVSEELVQLDDPPTFAGRVPPRWTILREATADYILAPGLWTEPGMGLVDGEWWETGNAEIRWSGQWLVRYTVIEIEAAGLARLGISRESTPPPTRRAGGAPRTYDWDGALTHVAAVAAQTSLTDTEGNPLNQTDIANLIGAWFGERVESGPPDERTRRKYAAAILAEIARLEA